MVSTRSSASATAAASMQSTESAGRFSRRSGSRSTARIIYRTVLQHVGVDGSHRALDTNIATFDVQPAGQIHGIDAGGDGDVDHHRVHGPLGIPYDARLQVH